MKKLIILTCMTIQFFMNGQSFTMSKGQESSEIPVSVTKQFKKDYPTFNPSWSKESYNYRADYINPANNTKGMVVYDKLGKTLKSETELEANSYPGSIGDYHTSNLPNSKYRVYTTKDTNGVASYYTTTEGETIYFDNEGRFKNRVKNKSTSSVPTAK